MFLIEYRIKGEVGIFCIQVTKEPTVEGAYDIVWRKRQVPSSMITELTIDKLDDDD
jgi:hypothetical protein